MNTILKRAGVKALALLLTLLISSVPVFAADNSNLSNEPLQGIGLFLSFSILLFFIVAPAFKKRERTTFLTSNNVSSEVNKLRVRQLLLTVVGNKKARS